MKKTALVYSPKYLDHKTGYLHPESPSRLRVIKRELNKSNIVKNDNVFMYEPQNVKMKDLEKVHDPSYIQRIKRFCQCGGGLLDKDDTYVSLKTFKVALLAAGGAVTATDLVMNTKASNAFAFVRPPGHHAGLDYSMGFCVFNNAAVAASYLIENFGLERILILDIDAHHGNGTQEIFYKTDQVLYISLHEDPIEFPLSGFMHEVGESKGLGFSVNVPFPYGSGDRIYLNVFYELVAPIIEQYEPQFILVSTGFDNHYSDPIGNLYCSTYSYIKIFENLLKLSKKFCQEKLVAVLEGGYSLQFIGKMACKVIANMARIDYSFKDIPHCAAPRIRKKAKKMICEVKNIQSNFWKIK